MWQYDPRRGARPEQSLDSAQHEEPQPAAEQESSRFLVRPGPSFSQWFESSPNQARFPLRGPRNAVVRVRQRSGLVSAPAGGASSASVRRVPDPQVLVEQFSRGMVSQELTADEESFVADNGYYAMPVVRGAREFVMRTFLPTEPGRPPVVAFRGTVPSKVETVIADLDPSGIGMYQFQPNRALIEAQIAAAAAHGPIISAGHSLGGALAQMTAAAFPDRVTRIVTFQAPGVSREMVQQLQTYNAEHPDRAITAAHHRVHGDPVAMGGQALMPGVIHEYQVAGGNPLERNPLALHSALPLTQQPAAAGYHVPRRGQHPTVKTSEFSTEVDNAEKPQVVEQLRTGLGHFIYGIQGIDR